MRMKKGLRANRAAMLLGISKSYISMIENGVVPLTDELRKKMATLYECHQKDLI